MEQAQGLQEAILNTLIEALQSFLQRRFKFDFRSYLPPFHHKSIPVYIKPSSLLYYNVARLIDGSLEWVCLQVFSWNKKPKSSC